MCIGGSKSSTTQTPAPGVPTRFEYNQPVDRSQQQKVAAANTPNASTGTFGSELGGAAPATTY